MRFANIDFGMKFIFLHPNRNGGKSIEKVLFGREPARGTADHMCAAQWVKNFGIDTWNEYFKFGFIRNPWRRIASIYVYRYNRNGKKLLMEEPDPFDFGRYLAGGGRVPMYPLDRVNQYDYFFHDGKPIDFIGSLENYEDDFEVVKKKIGLDPDIKLPHLNKSHREIDWRKLYDDKENVERVRDIYNKDVETWGFDFDTGPSKNYWRLEE